MIGVCIKYFHANYGGMLQAYATVKALEKYDVEYELIRYKKKLSGVGLIKAVPRLLNRTLRNDKYEALRKKAGKRLHPEFARNDAKRAVMFEKFCTEHFTRLSPVLTGYPALRAGADRYTAVLSGSDQLWSPAGLPTNYYNLMFVPDSILKISFASSFGVKNIPWYQKKRTKDYLDRIEYISMRENRGSEIVRKLTGREVPTVLDPVFLFDRAEWLRLIPDKSIYTEPYIFAYFLGANREHRAAVRRLADETGLKIVVLRHMDQYVREDETFGDEAPYDVGPEEFLNLLRHAAYVCTDSFHGTAFSIIQEKQFVVFDRYSEKSRTSKNSRIETLCRNLGMEDRRWTAGKDICEIAKAPIAYEEVRHKFTEQKRVTDEYLDTVLSEIRKREESLAGTLAKDE